MAEDDDGQDAILDAETLLRKALAVLIDVEAYLNAVAVQHRSEEALDLNVRTSAVLTAAAHARITGNI